MSSESVRHSCEGMDAWTANDSIPIGYNPKFGEFYVEVPDSDSYIALNYCPWCGARLPPSLRDQWFDRIFDLGLDGPEDPGVPDDMKSDAWWTKGE
ncbi:DUF6980 family protein [Nocardia suismassiliense]|uniref:DUF6980 family protein n=1 Tax=Nocardia suismassiliense TaxID=2077092 RepID=UPI003898E35F